MCDVEEFISGHQVCTSDMDLYITDSLQDMLDMDIKSEMATDLASGTDFSDALGLNFSEMPPLLDMETDASAAWLMSTNSSSFVHNLDLYGSEAHAVMVNPNSVMPSTFSEPAAVRKAVKDTSSPNLMLNSANIKAELSPAPSPKRERSHLTFSPSTVKLAKVKDEPEAGGEPDMEEATQMFIYVRKDGRGEPELESKKLKLTSAQATQPLLRIKSAPEVLKINSRNCSILGPGQKVAQSVGSKTIISGNIHILGAQQSRTILTNGGKGQTFLIDNGLSINSTRQLIKTSVPGTYTIENAVQAKYVTAGKKYTGEFPKPAYSYSCLIAMALKNSRTGSLPVSEIYNFMCQHFPYFKTAPNGWKNSVRHNLSLNKCFEKIEKPSTNGGQRKGCLWAMNPSKVDKMDEEVQKWSRKDPQAIRKAMVYPDNLEALERGEMKYSGGEADGELEGEGEGEGEGEELDGDAELDTDVEPDVDADTDVEALDDQELSEQELEVEEVVEGTGMVGGTYRLLAAAPHSYLTDGSGDEASDVEVTDHNYDEIDLDLSKPVKLEFAFSEDYEESSAKRAKNSFVYQPSTLTSTSHASRRKTPLVNRNYKIC